MPHTQHPVTDGDIISGELWNQFCDTLKQAGQQILRPEAPTDAATRAEGFRYLTRLLRIGLEMHVEFSDPQFPGFFKPSHETAKIGADNPDNLYQSARLNGQYEYRIRGQRNTVHYLSFRTQKGGYESDGSMIETGFLDSNQLSPDEQGQFEIIVSRDRPQQLLPHSHWLPMEADSNALVVRHTFHDRQQERAAELTLQRLDGDSAPPPLQAATLARGLLDAAHFVDGTARLFADWAASYLPHSNLLPAANQAECQSVGGDPNIFYYHSHWALAEDEALVVDVAQVPDCDTWNLQINNYWMESLDYRYHRICINKHTAHYHADGSVQLILAHRDPQHRNWLTTAGYTQGTLCFRWVGAEQQCHPTTRVVKLQQWLADQSATAGATL
ncbi:DUF1214 domain-containing protein [Aestuariicella hydrocarbonica]|uniref:DUF1214 domain-containing protein n=1 Tax=Pseudomaricurvus hydrocarbonicus TaxID=1470433 RepID=A0A9E5MHL9_9GAMM|nr:DUF1214 domain-containing protein [Aestuariicella hydrocarbonica]NHO66096.1 DUF1214 domain-containing protein [Aestuariicella hydrocarbonica]